MPVLGVNVNVIPCLLEYAPMLHTPLSLSSHTIILSFIFFLNLQGFISHEVYKTFHFDVTWRAAKLKTSSIHLAFKNYLAFYRYLKDFGNAVVKWDV